MRISDKIILGIDQGSSHTRASLFTEKGERLCQGSAPLRTLFPRPGAVEHDPKEILKSTFTAIRTALKKRAGKKIAAMGIANQRSTILCWDGKTGEPLSPAISWRSCAEGERPAPVGRGGQVSVIARHKSTFFGREVGDVFTGHNVAGSLAAPVAETGLPFSGHYSAIKLNRLLNQIGRNRKNLVAGTVNSFLIWHLTQGKAHLTDPTNAQRTLLYSITRHEWDDDLLRYFKIPRSVLPQVVPNQADFGEAVIDGVRIPIAASIGDQQSAFIGLGGLTAGSACINYGTGGFLLIHTGQKPIFLPGLLVSIALSGKHKTTYLIEGTVNQVGGLFTWLEQIGVLRSVSEIDSAYRRSKEKIFFLPALTGLGAPYYQGDVRGALFGLTASTQREDLIASAVTGIAYRMNDIYQVIPQRLKRQIQSITATGGGANIASLIQFQADLFGKTIAIATDLESTVRGVAFLAGQERGLTDETRFRFAPIRKKVEPKIQPKERANLIAQWKTVIARGRS